MNSNVIRIAQNVTSETKETVRRQAVDSDGLNPARGVINGLCIGAVLWIFIFAASLWLR